ncbi:Ig-like domain-containing protein [Parvularcula marina]|uniref:LysM peptidoglycan-binding domain-containing protein n=1 Tax=Parvularcula marina TaxID=2292771 RepID=A0A371R887_9PROT|nr:Ig-like domain-containing protein [Parvularcula marina]RFB01655.1 LysM peptidoglycan-binding domain-containing protein [Parvularcula marina]
MRDTVIAFIVIVIMVIAALVYWQSKKEPDVPDEGPVVTDGSGTPESEEAAPEAVALPRFDIIRVTREGYATIAGEAEPGASVELLANGEVIETVTAERDGNFVIIVEDALAQGAVEFKLRMTTPDGMVVTGAETIIVYVPERDGDLPVVLRTTPGGATEILQRATDPDPALGPLTIDTIDYDAAGNAIFSGRAEPDSVVQIFANNNPVGETTSDGAGRWTLSTTIPPGRYTLLIVQLGEDGAPKYAIEVPFEQARPENIVLKDGAVIVQPGNSLWVIARKVYGEGEQYTIIYGANADQIRDPDLIYPGQVFQLPEDEDEEEEDTSEEAQMGKRG